MEVSAQIPIAGVSKVYDVLEVETALSELPSSSNEGLKTFYEKMLKMGGERYVVKPSGHHGIDDLYATSPNFRGVIDDLRKYMALAVAGNEPMHFTPMLLLGEPGLGKTHFAKAVARLLGTHFEFVSMSSLTAGWILSGAAAQWTNARPGKVAQALVNGEYANPLMVIDEVDKAGGDHRYDPMGPLYTLLEHDTASHFKDEYIDVPIDASRVMWVATANDERNIPEPILNRMNVYTIERPDRDGSRQIARCLYGDILSQHRWGFDPEPPADVLEVLATVAPRDMRKVLLDAFGNATLAGRTELTVKDIHLEGHIKPKVKLGF